MDPRPQNYCSFYVKEPFVEFRVNATSTPDYCYYNLLKTWRRGDRSFNYYDAHCLTYNLRDGSDFEEVVKPLIHQRIDRSKNLILILTAYTKETMVMNEELAYGIIVKEKPVVVVYPELTQEEIIDQDGNVSKEAIKLWDAAPVFRDNREKVFVQHVPFEKKAIHEAINMVDAWILSKQS